MMALGPVDIARIEERLKNRWRGLVNALAREFGVSRRTIHRISVGKHRRLRSPDLRISELGLQPGNGKLCRKCGERIDPSGFMTATGLHVDCEIKEQARLGRVVIAEVKSV